MRRPHGASALKCAGLLLPGRASPSILACCAALQVELGLVCKSPGQLLGNTQVHVQDDLSDPLVSQGNGLHNSIAQLDDITLVD